MFSQKPMTETDEKPTRFTRARALLFLLASLAIGALLIVVMTWFVIGSAPRTQAVAIDESITVREFVALPDDDAYPAALALGPDGTLYTGSYQSGALWSISREGAISEIEGSRDRIGSVTGLDVAPDGALLVLDRVSALDAKGAVIWRYAEGELSTIVEIPHDEEIGVVLPEDIAVDGAGTVYISDRKTGRVWRYAADGENLGIWWQLPCADVCAATGLAYDPANDDILVTDSEANAIYRVSLNDGANTDVLLVADENDKGFGLDGIAVTPAGEVYVALLGWNRVARLQDGELVMLAREFRGASDLAYDKMTDRLFVTNWNQFSLGFGTRPQLPFAVDVIELSPEAG